MRFTKKNISSIQWRFLQFSEALLHKDLKCKAPLIDPNLRRNLGKVDYPVVGSPSKGTCLLNREYREISRMCS
ncbi:hypothetical protein FHY67_13850 [Acinetobacter radioresistens]|uniref:Uncharacterized protein n=1 Tax=Acinetobacter radioresistens TaxID=40216 RepID=A0A8H2JZ05_ACIRA|nr:hypothetical protein F7R60_20120 [Acinetobacter baumannii]TNX86082.1 hypothetical protein FHY67_13850 [Acinetobacter radioresistens]